MSDKERLENVRERSFEENGVISVCYEDYDWLIEQAERVQKSEADIEHYRKWLNSDIREKRKMRGEIERLREALEEIRSFMEYDAIIMNTDQARLDGIHKALEKFYLWGDTNDTPS